MTVDCLIGANCGLPGSGATSCSLSGRIVIDALFVYMNVIKCKCWQRECEA